MHKLSLIAVVAAIAATIGITSAPSGQVPDAQRAEIGMPSILTMMSDARSLPFTPLVSP